MPNFYIIAGCNGAGKTTASFTILPEVLNCFEFINADEIARGLSPLKPENAAFEAGRIMLNQIDKHIEAGVDFAIETILSSKHYVDVISKAKQSGYDITLLFFWLESVNIAKARVKKRVEGGGHNIPEDIIEKRYKRGLENFFRKFIDLADNWILVDNDKEYKVIAKKSETLEILNLELFINLKKLYE
jgi:predicted ABC-type ATPase